jgi:hypothetical protein
LSSSPCLRIFLRPVGFFPRASLRSSRSPRSSLGSFLRVLSVPLRSPLTPYSESPTRHIYIYILLHIYTSTFRLIINYKTVSLSRASTHLCNVTHHSHPKRVPTFHIPTAEPITMIIKTHEFFNKKLRLSVGNPFGRLRRRSEDMNASSPWPARERDDGDFGSSSGKKRKKGPALYLLSKRRYGRGPNDHRETLQDFRYRQARPT